MGFQDVFDYELAQLKEALVLRAGKFDSDTESGTMQVSTGREGESVKALVTYRRGKGFTVEKIVTSHMFGIE